MSGRQTTGGRDTQTANLDSMSSDDEDNKSHKPIPRKTQIAPVAKPRKTIANSHDRDDSGQKTKELSPSRKREVHKNSDMKKIESDEEYYSDETQRKSRRSPVRQERKADNEIRKSASNNKETPRKTAPAKRSQEYSNDSFRDDDTDHRIQSKYPTTCRKPNAKSDHNVQRKETKEKYKDDKYSRGDVMFKSSPPTTQSDDETNDNNVKLEGSKSDDTSSSSDSDDSNYNRPGSRRLTASPETNYKPDGNRNGGRNKKGSRRASDSTLSDRSSLGRQASRTEIRENEKARLGKADRTGEQYRSDSSNPEDSSRRKQASQSETSENERAHRRKTDSTGEQYSSDGNNPVVSSRRKQASRPETRENEKARRGKNNRAEDYSSDDGDLEIYSRKKRGSQSETLTNDRTRRGKTDRAEKHYSSDGSDSERFSQQRQRSSSFEADGTRREQKHKQGRNDFIKGNDTDNSGQRRQGILTEINEMKKKQRKGMNKIERQGTDDDNAASSPTRRKQNNKSRDQNKYVTELHDSGDDCESDERGQKKQSRAAKSHYDKARIRKGSMDRSSGYDEDSDLRSLCGESRGYRPVKDNKADITANRGRPKSGVYDDTKYGTELNDHYENHRSGRRVPNEDDLKKKDDNPRADDRIYSNHSLKENKSHENYFSDNLSPRRVKPETKYQEDMSKRPKGNNPSTRRPIGSDENAKRNISYMNDVTRQRTFDNTDTDGLGREQHFKNMYHSTTGDIPRSTGRSHAHDNRPGNLRNQGHTGGNYKQRDYGREEHQGYPHGGYPSSHQKSTKFEYKGRTASQQGGPPSIGLSHNPHTTAPLTDSSLIHILLRYPKFEAALLDLQKKGIGGAAIRYAVSTSKKHMLEIDDKSVRLRPQVRLCDAYESQEGCHDKGSCSGLHICSKYVLSYCSYNSCNFGHNFNTGHNKNILSPYEIPQERLHDVLKLSLAMPKALGKLQLCIKYNSSNCYKGDCDALHMCSLYLTNKLQCPNAHTCKFNHRFDSQHSAKLLRKHGIDTNESPMDILKTLEEEHPSLFKHQQQKQHQPTDYQMSTGFQGRSNSSGTGLSSGPRMSATQGAMTDHGSERPFHGNDRQNRALYGATGQTSNTSWSFHAEGSSIIDEICFHSVFGRCRNEATGCQRLHSHQHYHWQINDMNKRWLNLRQNQVDELERAFCDPNIDFVKVPQPEENKTPREILSLFRQGTWHADFQSMQLQNRSIRNALPLRRLCSENVNGKVPASIYQWYFLDQNRAWVEYGNVDTTKRDFLVSNITSDDIERHFLTNPAQPLVFQNNLFSYVLDFNSMTQTNTQTNVSREVKRRPVPHMKRAGFLNNIMSWVTP